MLHVTEVKLWVWTMQDIFTCNLFLGLYVLNWGQGLSEQFENNWCFTQRYLTGEQSFLMCRQNMGEGRGGDGQRNMVIYYSSMAHSFELNFNWGNFTKLRCVTTTCINYNREWHAGAQKSSMTVGNSSNVLSEHPYNELVKKLFEMHNQFKAIENRSAGGMPPPPFPFHKFVLYYVKSESKPFCISTPLWLHC